MPSQAQQFRSEFRRFAKLAKGDVLKAAMWMGQEQAGREMMEIRCRLADLPQSGSYGLAQARTDANS